MASFLEFVDNTKGIGIIVEHRQIITVKTILCSWKKFLNSTKGFLLFAMPTQIRITPDMYIYIYHLHPMYLHRTIIIIAIIIKRFQIHILVFHRQSVQSDIIVIYFHALRRSG